MKKYFPVLCFSFCLFFTSLIFSQEVNVQAGVPDALFNAVSEATAGDVLLLSDGGVYPNSATLPVSVPLTIKTVDGAAAKAKLVLVPDQTDTYPDHMIQADASITIKNVIASGQKGTTPSAGRFLERGNIGKIHLDGVEVSRFQIVSHGGPGDVDTLIVENCLFNGNLSVAGGWGGTFDFQHGILKYVKIQDNTFMYCTFGPFLGAGWGNIVAPDHTIPTIIIDHNTMYNITGAHGPTTMFSRAVNVTFTNNLYVNGTFRPNEFFSDKYIDFPENADNLGVAAGDITHLGPKGMWLICLEMVDSAGTSMDMRNNNISYTDEVKSAWSSRGLQKCPTWSNETAVAITDTSKAYFEENVTFINAPATPMFAVDSIAAHCALGNADTAAYKGTTPYGGWDWFDSEGNANFDLRSRTDMDMSYNTNATSYTAGTGGFPLGDLNWFPDKKAEWITSINETGKSFVPADFSFSQNYPNPFNPSTTISYTLRKTSNVKLTVYNILGKAVKTLLNQEMTVGTHIIKWDGTNSNGIKVTSGIYYYRLESDNHSKIMKMALIK